MKKISKAKTGKKSHILFQMEDENLVMVIKSWAKEKRNGYHAFQNSRAMR